MIEPVRCPSKTPVLLRDAETLAPPLCVRSLAFLFFSVRLFSKLRFAALASKLTEYHQIEKLFSSESA